MTAKRLELEQTEETKRRADFHNKRDLLIDIARKKGANLGNLYLNLGGDSHRHTKKYDEQKMEMKEQRMKFVLELINY